jgi:thiamine transporter
MHQHDDPYASEGSRGETLRAVTLVSVTVAMSFVCSYLQVPVNLPEGGQISLEPLPVIVLALMRGLRAGVTAGLLEGFLHFVREPIIVHPLSFLLDYPLPHAAVGLAALFNWSGERPSSMRCFGGLTLGLGASFAIHTVSGVLLFAQGKTGWAAWEYSLAYNGYYMLGQWVLAAATVPWLVPRLYDQDAV